MDLNADFSKRVVIHSPQLEWQDSPMPGVQRRMLDRIGDEVARATSIVRYAPNSHFSPHVHTGGEEFLVLDGVFQDEHGDFPAGAYIRNPPQSRHTPGAESGCTIFVKLWQFDLADRCHIRTHIDKIGALPDQSRPGVKISPLYEDARETVRIETWQADAMIEIDTRGGAELLVLNGGFIESGEELQAQSWLRIPVESKFAAKAGAKGARIWLKIGHLPYAKAPVI